MEEVAPSGNDPIMWGRSIWSFRHPECQNPSIISDYIGIPNGGEKSGKMSEEQEEEHKEELAESYSYKGGKA